MIHQNKLLQFNKEMLLNHFKYKRLSFKESEPIVIT